MVVLENLNSSKFYGIENSGGIYPQNVTGPARLCFTQFLPFVNFETTIIITATPPQTIKRPSIPFHIMLRDASTLFKTVSFIAALLL
jgi:hypothetical protein